MTPQLTKVGFLSPVTTNFGQCFERRSLAFVNEVRRWKTLYERFRQACRRHVLDWSLGVHGCAPMR